MGKGTGKGKEKKAINEQLLAQPVVATEVIERDELVVLGVAETNEQRVARETAEREQAERDRAAKNNSSSCCDGCCCFYYSDGNMMVASNGAATVVVVEPDSSANDGGPCCFSLCFPPRPITDAGPSVDNEGCCPTLGDCADILCCPCSTAGKGLYCVGNGIVSMLSGIGGCLAECCAGLGSMNCEGCGDCPCPD